MIDEGLVKNPFKPQDLHDCLVIFDDIDSIRAPKVRAAVQQLCDHSLEDGRHRKVHVVRTSHKCRNWGATRSPLTESDWIVFFLNKGRLVGRSCLSHDRPSRRHRRAAGDPELHARLPGFGARHDRFDRRQRPKGNQTARLALGRDVDVRAVHLLWRAEVEDCVTNYMYCMTIPLVSRVNTPFTPSEIHCQWNWQ
jgi:hypothetical protein